MCLSANKSGTTVTSAMYRKPPEVNGKTHRVLSSADCADSDSNAVIAPTTPPVAVRNCNKKTTK